MRVLVACEFSGIVRDAFRARGHDAWSCDLLPSERPGPHIQGDVLDVLDGGWALMIAHPPCTYLARSGARWWGDPEREREARAARDFVLSIWGAPIPRVAIENPVGRLNQWWRYPDQIVEPWYFGDPYRKRTCLWLRGLPGLMATVLRPDFTSWVSGGSFMRVSRRRVLPGRTRSGTDRSRTLPGVAAAMACQWG